MKTKFETELNAKAKNLKSLLDDYNNRKSDEDFGKKLTAHIEGIISHIESAKTEIQTISNQFKQIMARDIDTSHTMTLKMENLYRKILTATEQLKKQIDEKKVCQNIEEHVVNLHNTITGYSKGMDEPLVIEKNSCEKEQELAGVAAELNEQTKHFAIYGTVSTGLLILLSKIML